MIGCAYEHAEYKVSIKDKKYKMHKNLIMVTWIVHRKEMGQARSTS